LSENDWCKAKGRLVENEKLGLHNQGTTGRQHLLFAARQRSGGLRLALRENRKQTEHPGELPLSFGVAEAATGLAIKSGRGSRFFPQRTLILYCSSAATLLAARAGVAQW
jgi:hypothetical protein